MNIELEKKSIERLKSFEPDDGYFGCYSGGDFCLIDLDDCYVKNMGEIIGEDVFLTREEAEKALLLKGE